MPEKGCGDTDECDDGNACTTGDKCVAGKCEPGAKKVCDDGSPCTDDSCSADKGCVFEPVKKSCDDGNACTKGDACTSGKCVGGSLTKCDDGQACTQDKCDPATGECVHPHRPDGSSCTPPQADCWGNGGCKLGQCVGNTALCKCHPDWQGDDDPLTPVCPEWVADNNACEGKLYCKKSGGMYKCAINPATVITCSGSKDTECRKNLCDPKKATCKVVDLQDGTQCDDGDVCTKNPACYGGKCGIKDVQKDLICKCTAVYLDNCINELGNSPCDGILYCDTSDGKHVCKQAAKVACDPSKDTTCLKNTCDNKTGKCGKVAVLPKTPGGAVYCDDGDSCTPNESCSDGVCKPDEVNICSCTKDADCVSKDDGDACNGVLYCAKSPGGSQCVPNPASLVTCADVDNTACVVNFCLSKSGKCVMTPIENIKTIVTSKSVGGQTVQLIKQKAFPYKVKDYVPCDDGNVCTVNDNCVGTTCAPGATNTCACLKDSECQSQEDGDLCNGTLYCNKANGKCKKNPATVVTCAKPGDAQCTVTECNKKTGKCEVTSLKEGKLCDDGDACTVNESCQKGACSQQKATKICVCSSNADCVKEEDGNVCNGTLYCDKAAGKCKVNPTTLVKCNASNDTKCTQNNCVKGTGACKMSPVNVNLPCDDGDPCTASPICKAGQCFSETSLCQCKTTSDCAPFEDGNPCTGTLECDAATSKCVPKAGTAVKCEAGDGGPCVKNGCNAQTGKCAVKAAPDFITTCDDGNPCTAYDACMGGKCQAGANVCQCETDNDCAVIDDGNLCDGTLFCDKISDPKAFACALKPGSQVLCPKPKPGLCIESLCEPKTGKCEESDNESCDDGNACIDNFCVLDGPDKGKCAKEPAPDGVPAGAAGGDDGFDLLVCIGGVAKKAPKNMTLVPGGFFYMGCNPSVKQEDCGKKTTETQHKVELSPFWIDRYEVRTDMYDKCVSGGKCSKPGNPPKGCNFGEGAKKDHPINCITWDQASTFCKSRGSGYRLPTEAEWEKAARGGCEPDDNDCASEMPTWVWGNSPTANCQLAIMKDPANGQTGCGAGGTAPVGSRFDSDVSEYGVVDMAGNVREWTSDYWGADFYKSSAATKKDAANTTVSNEVVVRGGGWTSVVPALRTAARVKMTKASTYHADLGFRCVRTLTK